MTGDNVERIAVLVFLSGVMVTTGVLAELPLILILGIVFTVGTLGFSLWLTWTAIRNRRAEEKFARYMRGKR